MGDTFTATQPPRVPAAPSRHQSAAVSAPLYRERYPAMKSLDAYYGGPGGPAVTGAGFKGVPPDGNVVARNVAVGKWLDLGWNAKPEMFDVRDNYATTDPAQVLPGFQLPKDSPAWKLGFKPIAFDQIGLRRDADRQGLDPIR